MDDLIATFGRLEQGWENLTAMADEMQSREVRLNNFDAVYGTPDPDAQGHLSRFTRIEQNPL